MFIEQSKAFDIDDLPEIDSDGTKVSGVVQLQTPFGLVSEFQDQFIDSCREMMSTGDPMFEISNALFFVDDPCLQIDQRDLLGPDAKKTIALNRSIPPSNSPRENRLCVSIACRESL